MTKIKSIEERNRRVEANKAWETSKTRRVIIAIITYLIAWLFLWNIGIKNPELNALVPTGGYILSTLTLPFIKKYWLKKIYKK